jgi:hypothetical protein
MERKRRFKAKAVADMVKYRGIGFPVCVEISLTSAYPRQIVRSPQTR